MYTLKVLRHSQLKYETDEVLDLDLDPISYSGLDFHNQEARQCKLELLYDTRLEELLEGEDRDVRCGYHCLSFGLLCEGKLEYLGFLRADGIELEYLSDKSRLLRLNLFDWLGLILELGNRVEYELSERYVEPLHEICMQGGILDSILFPLYDSEDYKAAEVRALVESLGVFNYRHADASYEENWEGYYVNNHVMVDGSRYWYPGAWHENEKIFGFQYDDMDRLMVVLYQHVERKRRHAPAQESFLEKWQLRRFLVSGSRVDELLFEEEVNYDPSEHLLQPPIGAIHQHHWGVGHYDIEGYKALYRGYITFGNIEVVPGDYKADELMGEYLRICNAVMVLDGYNLRMECRLKPEQSAREIGDCISFEIDIPESCATEIREVSLASQALLDGLNGAYSQLSESYCYGFRLVTHKKIFPYDEMEVLSNIWSYGGYQLMALEVSYDHISREIQIRGRAKRTI